MGGEIFSVRALRDARKSLFLEILGTHLEPALAVPVLSLDKQLCSLHWALTLGNALQVNR